MYRWTQNERPWHLAAAQQRALQVIFSLLALLVTVVGVGGAPVASAHSGPHFGRYETWLNTPYFGERDMAFADVDSDGDADAIVVNFYGIVVRRAEGSYYGQPEPWTQDAYWGAIGTYFADVNGDDMADAIAVNTNDINVRLSNGSVFLGRQPWTYTPFFGTRGTYFADVTGDGRADAIAVKENGIKVRPAMGFGISAQFWPHDQDWTPDAFYGNRLTAFADVTGDGRADAIVVNDEAVPFGRIVVRPANGSGTAFKPLNEEWTQEPFYGSRKTDFADVTGDGRADAIAVREDAIYVRPANGNGTGFLPEERWTDEPYFGTHGTFFALASMGPADCDWPDYRADAIVVNAGGITVRRAPEVRLACIN